MSFVIGVILVIVSIILGYTMHSGDLSLLWQPNELIIILGAGIGASLIANPWYLIKECLSSFKCLFRESPDTKKDYLDLILFFFNITRLVKSKGMLEVESHIDAPHNSEIFSKSPSILKSPESLNFIKDNFRIITMGVDDPYQFSNMVDQEIDIIEQTTHAPSKAFLTLGDALPALGIVAAVLGVIVTMRSIASPPEVLGSMIAAALVGTFSGVLFAYGFFNPVGHFLSKYADAHISYFECTKVGFVTYLQGYPPVIIAEFMRKSIPGHAKPSFEEVEQLINDA